MKLPLKWLKDFVDYNVTNEEFVKRMLWRGFEVAEVIPEMPGIKNVYVCEIKSIQPHPNAERLRICKVDVGKAANEEGELIDIVTNAVNVYEGCQVPVALNGAVLSDGTEIWPTKMRGVLSQGMFCGGAELGINDVEYPGAGENCVLILNEKHINGQRIQEALDLDDVIFDIELTPNRPDCQSILGICREAAGALGQKFNEPVIEEIKGEGNTSDYVSVTVENPKLCPRYCARVVTDLKIEPSPRWMQLRLKLSGIRPINNIVDITNYVLLEYGHPMHAFDLACIDGGHIIVRNAKENEVATTLDGTERKTDTEMLLIADEKKGVAVAGVMGGENSEITENTKAALFESAVFLPANIRKTTQKLRFSTDSSARFVKGVEAVNAEKAIDRAVELVHKLGAGKVTVNKIDVCNADTSEKQVKADVKHINRILHTRIKAEKMCELLAQINIHAEQENPDTLLITVPHFRTDIEDGIETDWDIAEEIGRLFGYDNIPQTLMRGDTFQGKIGEKFAFEDKLKDNAAALGFMELYNYNFTSPQEYDMLMLPKDDEKRQTVSIRNPFGEDQSLMRTTLIGGMLRSMRLNCNRKLPAGRFFEVGNVHFNNNPELPEERKLLGLLAFGEDENFFSLKGTVEQLFACMGIENIRFERGGGEYLHPGQKASIMADGEVIGEMGTLHPRVQKAFELPVRAYIAEISFAKMFEHSSKVKKYKPLAKFPVVPRDLAIIADEDIEAQQIIDTVKSAKLKVTIENIYVFDVYYPKCEGDKGIPAGKKSMAFRFELRSDERTLNDEDINHAVKTILKTLKYKLNAELRS